MHDLLAECRPGQLQLTLSPWCGCSSVCLSPEPQASSQEAWEERQAVPGQLAHLACGWARLRPDHANMAPCPVSVVEAFEEVADSLCVPQYNKDGEERVVLFLKMAPGHTFQPDLVKRIQNTIRIGLSSRHVPSLILKTEGIPVRPLMGLCLLAAVTRAPSSPHEPTHSATHLGACLCFIYSLSLLPGNAILFSCRLSFFFNPS